jgi:6-phosphogluconolactonase
MNNYLYLSLAGEDKVLIFDQNATSGELTNRREVATPGGPGPLATDPEERLLYVGLRGSSTIAAYQRNREDGGLASLNSAALDADPCYLATDRHGRFLFAAYYGAGKVTVHALGEDGSIGELVCSVATAGHAHCIQADRSNRFVFVPHTCPANMIFQFRYDENTGMLTANEPAQVTAGAGEGPRHFVFHPTKDWVYVSNEDNSSAGAYTFDPEQGTLSAFQILSTLPDSFTGSNTCAQIHMDPSGRFLYISNRGHDSIACFAVDEETGRLTAIGQAPSEATPRVFGLDPAGNHLYAAGQASGRLAAYRIDSASGSLEPIAVYDVGERPMWVKIIASG